MKILGIDPGYDLVGFGYVERINSSNYKFLDAGVIKTDPKMEYWQRLQNIYQDMSELLANFKPDVCSMESLFFARNTTTAMKVAQARGVIGLACTKFAVPIFEYTPLQIKMTLTGQGRAEKWQVQEMVQRILGLSKLPKPDDMADALAVALTYSDLG